MLQPYLCRALAEVFSGPGCVSGGIATLGTVSAAIIKHKDVLTSKIGGTVSAIKGDSFSEGIKKFIELIREKQNEK